MYNVERFASFQGFDWIEEPQNCRIQLFGGHKPLQRRHFLHFAPKLDTLRANFYRYDKGVRRTQ
jgi:hypothetical protein